MRSVTNEKHELTEEAQRLIKTIRQMEAAMNDNKTSPKYKDDEPQVTYPLTRCLKTLKEKYNAVARQHQERFEQVRSKPPPLSLICGYADAHRTRRGSRFICPTP